LNLSGFEYQSSEDVRDELRKACADPALAAAGYKGSHKVNGSTAADGTWLDLPMYQIDALVRRSPSLQKTREGRTPAATY
jgi:NADH-quinone oxidoreductase subunit G